MLYSRLLQVGFSYTYKQTNRLGYKIVLWFDRGIIARQLMMCEFPFYVKFKSPCAQHKPVFHLHRSGDTLGCELG